MFERTGKVYKQGGLTMTIPQVYAEALGIKVGDVINLSLDMETKSFSVSKTQEHSTQEIFDVLTNMGMSHEIIEELKQYLDKKEEQK